MTMTSNGDAGSSFSIYEVETAILCKGTDEEMTCIGFRRTVWKEVIFYFLVVFSLGALYLVVHWHPVLRTRFTKKRCKLFQADTVVLKDQNDCLYVEEIVICDLSDDSLVCKYSSSPQGNKVTSIEGTVEYAFIEQDRNGANVEDTSALTIKTKILLKYFDHKYVRFVWKEDSGGFVRLSGLDCGLKCQEICENFNGLTRPERINKLQLFGSNTILVEVKSYFKLFFEEVLNPFYVFQIFSVILWFCDNYYIYASCIILISTISLGVELYEIRKQRVTLRDMVASTETTVNMLQANGEIGEIGTTELVPGDVIIIPAHGCVMSCDAVLIAGNAIVDEGMLTGESVPVTKTPLAPSEPGELFSPEVHKRNTLFCGTRVIQTRYYGDARVKAVVVRTGFSTAKGELVRSIIFPKELFFQFYRDAIKFVVFLGCIACVGMIYICTFLIIQHSSARVVILNMLDIVTVAVPPALPAAMTVGTIFAQARLKKAGIFCISPQRINLSGKIQCFCFDKTGTLTEEGLDLWAVIPVEDHKFLPAMLEPQNQLSPYSKMAIGMATCHSLTMIDKELNGDPLDMKMFASINWVLEEPGRETAKFDLLMPTIVRPITRDAYGPDQPSDITTEPPPFEVGVVRQFTFSSGLQRMSVIVRVLGSDHMDVYAKGAPEKISGLCLPETVPEDFQEVLKNYTAQGLRVIAVAMKSLDSKISWHQVQRISRDVAETELTFVGLLIMENKLKVETTPVIKQLHAAKIRTIMVTGDNILTAISVARHCGMVPDSYKLILVNAQPPEGDAPASIRWEAEVHMQNGGEDVNENGATVRQVSYQASSVITDFDLKYRLALTGRSFGIIHRYFPELVPKIALYGTIFARMTPDQKSKLIEDLQDLGLYVGMCGDGANDCGALRTAHAGISLSEAEASVASPFTSKAPNISCVPTVIREGRAALVTSFAAFKFMALYSIVQYVAVIILISNNSKLSDGMFLYADLFITTILAVLMGHTGAYDHLDKRRPTSSLASPFNILAIIFHIVIVVSFQVGVSFFTIAQPWYEHGETGEDGEPTQMSLDTTAIFYISSFQYLVLAFVLAKGPPYRKRIWTNIPFLVWLIVMVIATLVVVIYPPNFILPLFTLDIPPSVMFRLILVGLASIDFLLTMILEDFIVSTQIFKRFARNLFCSHGQEKPYKTLQIQHSHDPHWPPVGTTTTSSEGDSILRINLS